MDINEKNPPRTEGQNEGGKPREGKRPPNRNNRRPNNRPQYQGSEHAPAPTQGNARNTAQGADNRHSGQSKQAGRHPSAQAPRPDRRNDARNSGNDGRNAVQAPPRPNGTNAENADRRQHPSAGRPQRMPRRPAPRNDLPDMDDLLIDDGLNTANGARTCPKDAPDAAELERILENDVFARREEVIPDVIPAGKVVIAGIRFRTGGKTYFFDPGSLTCTAGQYAIVETARGMEFGEICIGNRMVDESMVVPPLRPVIRIATDADIAHNKENREREEDAFRIGLTKIAEHKLDMKLVSVQYTFDNAKLLFYFTSAGRVDFRELVKDLAAVFHIRIELRQIGIRDEARMIGGLGACGRPLCCNTFLSDFGQVSMKMAKEQNLSLNSSKISGCCGRLMCCLRYEYDTYTEEIRKTPSAGTIVNTPDGLGVVTEIFPLQGEVKVSLRNQPDSAPKRFKRELVEPQARTPRTEVPAAQEDTDEPDSDE